MGTRDAVEYARAETLGRAPDPVAAQVRARVLDVLAAATAGFRFPAGDVAREFTAASFSGDAATLLDGTGDARSLPGATLANATAANVLDVDDGHRAVKGHPAAVVVPAALAAAESEDATVGEFLDAVLVGYELGVRAGVAIHETDDLYTGTGSWGALGAAAAVSRLRGLDDEAFAHALGTAEYHAPRTPIMRGVERPGMTKDGIGWGAYVGVEAVRLAEHGFTGSGTAFDDGGWLGSLGDEYRVADGYLKPYPCCRWAQPGVDAARELADANDVAPGDVERVVVHTFAEATRLRTRAPSSVEAAEYSYPYPVAAAVVRGQFSPAELGESARTDPTILGLAEDVRLVVDERLDDRFPEACLARVDVETADATYRSAVTRPRGAAGRPLDADERLEKARALLEPSVGGGAVGRLRDVLRRPRAPANAVLDPWRRG